MAGEDCDCDWLAGLSADCWRLTLELSESDYHTARERLRPVFFLAQPHSTLNETRPNTHRTYAAAGKIKQKSKRRYKRTFPASTPRPQAHSGGIYIKRVSPWKGKMGCASVFVHWLSAWSVASAADSLFCTGICSGSLLSRSLSR